MGCTIVPTAAKPATSPGPAAYSRAEKSSPPPPLPRSRRTPRRRCGWRHARLRRRRRPPQRHYRAAQDRRSLRLQTLLRLSQRLHHALPGYFPPTQRSHPSRSHRPRRPGPRRKTQTALGRRRRHPMRIPRKLRRAPPNQIPLPRLLIHIWSAVALPPLLRLQRHHPASTHTTDCHSDGIRQGCPKNLNVKLSQNFKSGLQRGAPGAVVAPGVLFVPTHYILNANVFFLINVVI